MIIALAFLAVADLIVGVSNDAVNFLNSAIGSKVVSFKTIMIVASIGVVIGAIFSSGLMEVARKGIFNPGEFMFNEIMIIFMAVMITDILLLDFFNTVGMPTSTTVSIVFELLGAAVAMAFIKIYALDGRFSDVINYINTDKATQIIFGILLSVIVAFTIGAIVQWFSRVLLSYNFNSKPSLYGAIFGGIALTAITYFILMKGIKGTPFANSIVNIVYNGSPNEILDWANNYFGVVYESMSELAKAKKDIIVINFEKGTIGLTLRGFLEVYVLAIVIISLVIWSVISLITIKFLKTNIYKLIILVGTFALALAFAGNDLVNFIGVPIAAYQSFLEWSGSGIAPEDFNMKALAAPVETPTLLLVLSGIIMVTTLWFSSRAKTVVQTSIDLSSQEATKERFQPNWLSRGFVRLTINASRFFTVIFPNSIQKKIDKQFVKPVTVKTKDAPAFDMVRAAVNLMVASVLISIATSMKLPLSTTYVTFMVAMGTSLADRAWGAESAVYRVAGVLNVIGGWFFTAIMAFISAGVIVYLINLNVPIMVSVLLLFAIVLIIRNYMNFTKKAKEAIAEDKLKKSESSSIQGVIVESSHNIANVVKRANKIYTNVIEGLARQDVNLLKKNKKQVHKLTIEIDELRDNIFYFIKNLDESSIGASNFYIHVLGYIQDMTQSLDYIAKATHKHVNNNHKKLTFTQIKELKEIDNSISALFTNINGAFDNRSFEQIGDILTNKNRVYDLVKDKINKQVKRTRDEESSPKNTTLYFSLLLETKDLLNALMNLLQEYHDSHDSKVAPAKIEKEEE